MLRRCYTMRFFPTCNAFLEHRVTSPKVQGKTTKNISIRIRATLPSGYSVNFTVCTGSYKRCYIRPYLDIIRKAITSFIIRRTQQILCTRLIKSLATFLLLDLVSSTSWRADKGPLVWKMNSSDEDSFLPPNNNNNNNEHQAIFKILLSFNLQYES